MRVRSLTGGQKKHLVPYKEQTWFKLYGKELEKAGLKVIDPPTVAYTTQCEQTDTTRGTFHLVAPYLYMPKHQIVSKQQMVEEMMGAMFGGEGMQNILDMFAGGAGGVGSKSAGRIANDCDCSCENLRIYEALTNRLDRGETLTPAEQKILQKMTICLMPCMMKMMECEDE